MPRVPIPRGALRPPPVTAPPPFVPARGAAVLPIREYPDAALRGKCEPFPAAVRGAPPEPAAAALLRDLPATLHARRGLGLAAPQVGALLRAFVVRTPLGWTAAEAARARGGAGGGGGGGAGAGSAAPAAPAAPGEQPPARFFTTCLNPRILERSADARLGVESCLSLEGEAALVLRAHRITAEWEEELEGGGGGEGGEPPRRATVRRAMDGLPAVVFQHELDHLCGVLIVDRAFQVPERERDVVLAEREEHFRRQLRRFYARQ
jgi:peptide deformylase